MLTYRATLRPRSATLSPWQADTLFGQLCWLIRYEEGEAVLDEFLTPFRQGQPPLLFSNGFPADLLPRPQVPVRRENIPRNKTAQVSAMQAAKEGKAIRWIRMEEFNALRRGESPALQKHTALEASKTVLKNQINRLTGGTTGLEEGEGGGNLYSLDELAFVDASEVNRVGLDVSVYVKAADETWGRRAGDLLERLARSGYGKKKSSGYGHFKLEEWERYLGFDASPFEANGFISLSNWVPAKNDPVQGFYTVLVKYGKLGEELANSENPFKYPLTMLTAGSSFYAAPPLGEWYGQLVEGIAPADERVVQYGFAFAVPAQLAEEG